MLLAYLLLLVLGLFGLVFSFANYPVLATALLLLLGGIGSADRRRRRRRRERVRRRQRAARRADGYETERELRRA